MSLSIETNKNNSLVLKKQELLDIFVEKKLNLINAYQLKVKDPVLKTDHLITSDHERQI